MHAHTHYLLKPGFLKLKKKGGGAEVWKRFQKGERESLLSLKRVGHGCFRPYLCLLFLQSIWFFTSPWLELTGYHSLVQPLLSTAKTYACSEWDGERFSARVPVRMSQQKNLLNSKPKLTPIFCYPDPLATMTSRLS